MTGLLCRSPEGCAYQIRHHLERTDERGRLDAMGREWVREQCLITGNLRRSSWPRWRRSRFVEHVPNLFLAEAK